MSSRWGWNLVPLSQIHFQIFSMFYDLLHCVKFFLDYFVFIRWKLSSVGFCPEVATLSMLFSFRLFWKLSPWALELAPLHFLVLHFFLNFTICYFLCSPSFFFSLQVYKRVTTNSHMREWTLLSGYLKIFSANALSSVLLLVWSMKPHLKPSTAFLIQSPSVHILPTRIMVKSFIAISHSLAF